MEEILKNGALHCRFSMVAEHAQNTLRNLANWKVLDAGIDFWMQFETLLAARD